MQPTIRSISQPAEPPTENIDVNWYSTNAYPKYVDIDGYSKILPIGTRFIIGGAGDHDVCKKVRDYLRRMEGQIPTTPDLALEYISSVVNVHSVPDSPEEKSKAVFLLGCYNSGQPCTLWKLAYNSVERTEEMFCIDSGSEFAKLQRKNFLESGRFRRTLEDTTLVGIGSIFYVVFRVRSTGGDLTVYSMDANKVEESEVIRGYRVGVFQLNNFFKVRAPKPFEKEDPRALPPPLLELSQTKEEHNWFLNTFELQDK